MRYIALLTASAALALAAGATAAAADECSGHNHDTGTVVGGVGGAAIGGLASHSVVGAVAGGVVGALAGNAIARSEDCDRQAREEDRADRHAAYEADRDDQAYEDTNGDHMASERDRRQAYEAGRDDQAMHDADRQAEAAQARADADDYPQ